MKKNNTFRFFLFSSFLFLLSSASIGQKKGEFILIGTVLENEIVRIDGVTVSVYEFKEKIFDTLCSKRGKFELTLQMNSDYVIEFSKPGYVSKSISVSTEPPTACTIRSWEEDIGSAVSLFKVIPGANYSMYKHPIAYFEFNEKCNFRKDENYEKTVSAIQTKVRDDITNVQKEVAKSNDTENKVKEEQEKQKQLDEKYRELIRFADEEFNDRNYEAAKGIYTEALKVKPNQIYPENQLMKIHGLLAAKQKETDQQKPKSDDGLAKKTEKAEPGPDTSGTQGKNISADAGMKDEDLKKTEKKTEALLHLLSDMPPYKEINADLEQHFEMEKRNDLKSFVAHTNAKRIFLEEIADSQMRMKQQKSR